MKIAKLSALLIIGAFLLIGQQGNALGGDKMEISSSAFKDGGKIPVQYVMPKAGGKNISVSVSWKNPPEGTKSFALSMVDPHPVAKNWVHWLIVNIPAGVTAIAEGASPKKMPAGCVELQNSYGEIGYGGPQPPPGTGDHPYVLTIYALSVERLNLPTNASLVAFNKALEGKVLGSTTVTGKYSR